MSSLRYINCNEIYEEALTLFAIHDKEFEHVLNLTNPIIESIIIISPNSGKDEEYLVKTAISFPEDGLRPDLSAARAIFKQKFVDIENILDLQKRLNEVSFSKQIENTYGI